MQTPTREQLLRSAFPAGVPRLWCPPLTHYDQRGALDEARMAAHWRHLAPHVRGFLVPGSTGDGWELTPVERRQTLALAIRLARQLDVQVLIGALHPDAAEARNLITEDLDWLRNLTAESAADKVLAKAHVCAFTVCAPRGRDLPQEEIRRGLSSLLELGLPTAIYQLPQVTLNEIHPDVAADLARRYQNFVFFKDTSGADRVVLSGEDLMGVFRARGAEGNYARWLKAAGGPYDGFLLSSANCFARQLEQMAAELDAGRLNAALELSEQLDRAVGEVFRLAAGLPQGNAFANSNKAIDHFFAHGPQAAGRPSPRLHAGSSLPIELIRSTGQILAREGLLPSEGYLR